MTTINQLAAAVQKLAAGPVFLELLRHAEDQWEDDRGCQYVTVTALETVERILSDELNVEEVEANIIKVTGTLPLHFHRQADAAIVVIGAGHGNAERYCAYDDTWRPLVNGEVVINQATVVHGFRTVEGQDEGSAEPYFLIGLSSPVLDDEEDTVYID